MHAAVLLLASKALLDKTRASSSFPTRPVLGFALRLDLPHFVWRNRMQRIDGEWHWIVRPGQSYVGQGIDRGMPHRTRDAAADQRTGAAFRKNQIRIGHGV